MEEKKHDFANCGDGTMTDDVIRLREEITMQYKACLLYTSDVYKRQALPDSRYFLNHLLKVRLLLPLK